MRTRLHLIVALISFVILLVIPLRGVPQEKTAEKPATGPAGKPGAAEMERLKFYLGEWDYIETYPKSGAMPNGGKNTGVYTSKLGPGGNSLINTFHSQGAVGDFEGLLILTWEPREKAYKMFVFGSDHLGTLVETGQFEGDVLVYRAEMSMGGATVKLRNITHVVSPGKIETEQYATVNDAPEKMLVHVDATKR